MDVPLIVKRRLEELHLDQRDLAAAAQVTESYISQLLTGKKVPPDPERTDIYNKMGKLLRLPANELAKLAHLQRLEEAKRKLADAPAPLFNEVRELVLRKCKLEKQKQIRAIFERQPFGELERLITQKLLDVVKRAAREELENENWVRLVASLSDRSTEEMRVAILEFLDANIFNVSNHNCESFLNPLIEWWDVDLGTFDVEIVLNHRVAPGHSKKFAFVEKESEPAFAEEPGLKEFLKDASLNGDATGEEIEFLTKLRFRGRQPTALYYYRELQNLRDPLHFRQS